MSAKDTKKLSGLGAEIEAVLSKLLKEIKNPKAIDDEGKQYSLTDRMKVLDRALKWEAIKNKADDGEGDFFTPTDSEGAEDDAE